MKKKATKRASGLALTLAMLGAGVPGLAGGLWWARGAFRDGFQHDQTLQVQADTPPNPIGDTAAFLKDNFPPAAISYQTRGNVRDADEFNFTEDELNLITKERINDFEVLDVRNTSSGFDACALKDKKDNSIILAIAGAGFTDGSTSEILADIDDMYFCTSGGRISQLDDTVAFAKEIEEKHGKINKVVGHSLGGYCGMYLVGSGILDDAVLYAFDIPGVTHNMIHHCANMGKISEDEVKENFSTKVVSTSIRPNSFNRLGVQPGTHYTVFDDPNSFWQLFPEDHIYSDFVKQLEIAAKSKDGLKIGDSKGQSGGPTLITIALATVTLLSLLGAKKVDQIRRKSDNKPPER